MERIPLWDKSCRSFRTSFLKDERGPSDQLRESVVGATSFYFAGDKMTRTCFTDEKYSTDEMTIRFTEEHLSKFFKMLSGIACTKHVFQPSGVEDYTFFLVVDGNKIVDNGIHYGIPHPDFLFLQFPSLITANSLYNLLNSWFPKTLVKT